MQAKIARCVIAGLSGDSGKTIVSLAIICHLRSKGLTIAPFKKGPDYIDAAWLGAAAGNLCRNLDTFMVDEGDVLQTFTSYSSNSEMAVIEGNRGLFDGKDAAGSHSTAELAKLLAAPLFLVIDVTKSTRTIAALVKGCRDFDPGLDLAGIILNNVAGDRHRRIITESIEKYCNVPVLGSIPKLSDKEVLIPGRHLGLVPPAEFSSEKGIFDRLAGIAEKYIDIDRILEIANDSSTLDISKRSKKHSELPGVKIGFFKDSAFTFYYPENLEALSDNGAEMVPVSSLSAPALPDIDALYIGGGFPETHARQLADNRSLMISVKEAAENGMPIYAECGGLIYLSRSLKWKKETIEMSGVFPIDLEMHSKPVGHGYTEIIVDQPNRFFDKGTTIRGHEFHYSAVVPSDSVPTNCFRMDKGTGIGSGRDGLIYRNTLACYTHIHAGGVKSWAEKIVSLAREYSLQKRQSGGGGIDKPSKHASAA